MDMLDVLNTAEAAQELHVTPDRVRKLIRAQRLPARKLGRDWAIARTDLAGVTERRPGRPRRVARLEGRHGEA
jgi:excisionase family DNA binding protein